MKLLFLDIGDKKIISKERFCPPHYFPHKLPVGKHIIDELCHIHDKKWRKIHHEIYCKFLKCQNYEFMIESYNKK